MTKNPVSPPDHDAHELGELAADLACKAGELVERMRADIDLAGKTKSSLTDVVTEADQAAEEQIISSIRSARPDDGVLGEEGGDIKGTSGVRWIIDPIDGTTNYVYNLPAYTVSVAAEIDGTVVAGAVVEPKNKTLYRAVLGAGAERNGQPIHVTNKSDLATALVATGFGYQAELRRHQGKVLAALLPQLRDIRRFGSAALDLCLVAEGLVDGYYERGLNYWDMAAGWLIASEAGAVVSDLRQGPPSQQFLLAAGPRLAPLLGAILRENSADTEL